MCKYEWPKSTFIQYTAIHKLVYTHINNINNIQTILAVFKQQTSNQATNTIKSEQSIDDMS